MHPTTERVRSHIRAWELAMGTACMVMVTKPLLWKLSGEAAPDFCFDAEAGCWLLDEREVAVANVADYTDELVFWLTAESP